MNRAASTGGIRFILTADDSLMADYPLLFDGMLAAGQTTTTPRWLLRHLMPRNAAATTAPLGLRRIESALIRAGVAREAVVIVHQRDLPSVIGPETRIVGISSGEPTGRGMNSATMTGIAGGEICGARLFRALLSTVRQLVAQHAPAAKIVLGGAGAWQLSPAGNHGAANASAPDWPAGIDHVVTGYAEANVAELFQNIIDGTAPPVLTGNAPPAGDIPALEGPSTFGAVELSRGCGLGCSFCTLARRPMQHLPPDAILADAHRNLRAGHRHLTLLTEDIFRYGAEGLDPNPDALLRLLESLRRLEGPGLLQCDHAGIVTASRWPEAELRQLRNQLVGSSGQRFPWVNLGVETASGALLRRHGTAKMGPVPVDEWAAFCATEVQRLCRVGFFPLVSLILNLPGEQPAEVRATRRWVERLADLPLAVFPVQHAPLDISTPEPPLTRDHRDLIRACYRINFRHLPTMVWDNQTAAGIPRRRRIETRILAAAGTLLWNARLKRLPIHA